MAIGKGYGHRDAGRRYLIQLGTSGSGTGSRRAMRRHDEFGTAPPRCRSCGVRSSGCAASVASPGTRRGGAGSAVAEGQRDAGTQQVGKAELRRRVVRGLEQAVKPAVLLDPDAGLHGRGRIRGRSDLASTDISRGGRERTCIGGPSRSTTWNGVSRAKGRVTGSVRLPESPARKG